MKDMKDREKIIWDSMISTIVMGKVMPIKIIDDNKTKSSVENKFIYNLNESKKRDFKPFCSHKESLHPFTEHFLQPCFDK